MKAFNAIAPPFAGKAKNLFIYKTKYYLLKLK